MPNQLGKNSVLLIFIFTAIVIILGFIYNLLSNQRQRSLSFAPSPTPIPTIAVYVPPQIANRALTPSITGTYSPQYLESARQDAISHMPDLDQRTRVAELVQTLPYAGRHFDLNYDYHTTSFLLLYNAPEEAIANAEFDAFLQSRGIASRSWLKQIKITAR